MLKNKIILGLIGFYIFWIVLLPFVLSKGTSVLCQNFSHNSDYEINVENPKFVLSPIPNLKFSAKKLSVKSKKESLLFNTEDFSFKIRLLPLLSGRIHFNSILAKEIIFNGEIVEDFEIKKSLVEKGNDLKFKVDKIGVNQFEIVLFNKDIKEPILFKGKGFEYQLKNRNVKFVLDSELKVADKKSIAKINLFLPCKNDIKKTKFEVDCSNIDISPFKDYFKTFLPNDLKELKGDVSIKANKGELITEINNCAFIMEDPYNSLYFPKKMVVKSLFTISKNLIDFTDVTIKSDKISISLSGKIKDYVSKTHPSFDLNIRIDKSRVEEIVKMLPSIRMEEIDVYKLKQYPFYGETLANFSIKGRLPEPEIIGDVYIDEGVLIKPIPNTSRGATIKINMVGKYLNYDALVPAGANEKVWVKGGQEIYNMKYADLTIKSTESVNLKSAQNVLNPLHEILNFDLGPVPIMDINGKGNIDIIVKGNRKNPRIWGVFNVNNGLASFNDISQLKVKDINAILKFEDEKATFVTKKAVLNGQNLAVNGICDLYGKFDFDVTTKNQASSILYKAIKASKIISDSKQKLPNFDVVNGSLDLNLKLHGNIKNISDLKINENVFAKGQIVVNKNNISLDNVEIKDINGAVKVSGLDSDISITALSENLPFNIKAKIKNKIANIEVDAPKLNLNSFVSDLATREKQYLPIVSLKGAYKDGSIDKIDFSKLDIKAITQPSVSVSNVKYKQGGLISISNNKVLIKKIKGYLINENNTFSVDINVDDLFEETMNVNGGIKLITPDASLLNEVIASDILPDVIKRYVKDYQFQKGPLNLDAKVLSNKIFVNSDLSGIILKYLPLDLPIEVINGGVSIRNNTLKINKLNVLADKMPILLDGDVRNIFDKQNFNIYLNSKPQQEFIDKYINKNQIYPIKMKGDIVYSVKLKGEPQNLDVKAKMNMSKDSSLYHFGATVGDIENAIELSIDTKILAGNIHKIKEFSYDKLIESQSGRQTKLNMLKASGGVKILEDDLLFDNLGIKTNHPTDARIFNIIFRKPNIKQGQFTSDLKLNGKLSDAKILGDFYIFETNIPFLDTSMKSLELLFKDKTIEFASKGEVMGNDILFDGVLQNKLTEPYRIEKATLQTKDLDLNKIVNKLKISQVENVSTFESFEGFDINSIIADNFVLKADNIQLRNIHATNLEAVTSLSQNGVFDVKDFKFNIAQGTLGGKYKYNFENNDMGLVLKANSISANDITWALFDLNNQIHGDLTGDIDLTCNGANFNHCMQTLSGTTTFNVKDGRMPKLGSLEYLLKAGNLVKGGLTGLSINSVVDLIAPSNIGEFSEIFGTVRIKDGIARNIEIASRGDNLSLYAYGTYNFATTIADMEVLGLLSRKMSTMFGSIGNVSINTLFNLIPGVDLSKDSLVLERINKIPGVEISNKAYRKFIAEIKGDIDGDDYVTSFKWIN